MPSPDGKLGPTLDRMDYGRALKGALLMNDKNWVPYAQPLLDAVSLFEELNLGYALIGGIAAMYYGRARFTEDVDFVAVAGHANVFTATPQQWKNITSTPPALSSYTTRAAFTSIYGKMTTPSKSFKMPKK